MKVKLGQIVNSKDSFNVLIEKNISFKANYKLSKLLIEISKELDFFEKKKQELFIKYGEEVEIEGVKQLQIKPKNMDEFSTNLNDILTDDVKLEYEPMFIEDLSSIKEGKEQEDAIKIKEMFPLLVFFKSKEDVVVEEKKEV